MKVKESEKAGLKLNIQKTKIIASGSIPLWQIGGETMETVTDYFGGLQNHCRWWLKPWNLKRLAPWKEVMTNLDSILKSTHITLPIKVHLVKAMVFSVVMYGWELDDKESWVPKNWCFWTVVLKTLESLGRQEIHQSILFIGTTDAETETPILWPPDEKSWLIWKDPDAGKDWGQEGKGMTQDEMIGWHHRLNGHEFE